MMISPAIGYWIEGSSENSLDVEAVVPIISQEVMAGVFDLSDNDYLYYRDHFLDQAMTHLNFLGTDPSIGPIAISVVKDEKKWKAIIRTMNGNTRAAASFEQVQITWWRKLLAIGPGYSDILKAIDPSLPVHRLKAISDPRLPQALLNLEEKQTIKGFKFGLMYCQENQYKEEDMFANVEGSKEFMEFMLFLGKKVKLQGWPHFRAGLDVRGGTTGKHSIYHKWNNNEIMWHVSTLLPFNPKDRQQLERKRHIGNDIVVVVFIDGDSEYKPTTISSRQVHVVFVVKAVRLQAHPNKTYYKVAVVAKDEVPRFGPPLPANAIFRKGKKFRNFFYAKILNAEKASYEAPALEIKLSRTRTALLKDIAQGFC